MKPCAKQPAAITTPTADPRLQAVFFSGCPHPFTVASFKAALAAGQRLQVSALPIELWPCALLLHAVAPEPGIVDDIALLVEYLLEEYNQPLHGPRWWHPQGFLVSSLVYGIGDPNLNVVPDAAYIGRVLEELTGPQVWKKMFAGLPQCK